MERKSRDWKRMARGALSGRFLIAIGAMMAVEGVSFLSNTLLSGVFQGTSFLSLVIYQTAAFIITLIMAVFQAGLSYLYLNMARNREYSMRDLLFHFYHHPDRVIGAAFVLALIDLVVSIPSLYVSYSSAFSYIDDLEALMAQAQKMSYVMLITSLVGTLVKIPFEMTYYIMADDLEIGGFQALKASVSLMRGRILKYLWLEITFLPLAFLCMLTMGIGLIWLIPYMVMTTTEFYRDQIGELDPPRIQYDSSSAIYGAGNPTKDDFNSEA